jgi:hypothetical protein
MAGDLLPQQWRQGLILALNDKQDSINKLSLGPAPGKIARVTIGESQQVVRGMTGSIALCFGQTIGDVEIIPALVPVLLYKCRVSRLVIM